MDLIQMAKNARRAAHTLALIDTQRKNSALEAIAGRIWSGREKILDTNSQDIDAAARSGLQPALVERLTLNEARLNGMAKDLINVASLPDPVGERFDEHNLPSGLKIHKQRVPLGVLAVIYESRPNVTLDVASLALKSGNAAILRGGSETIATNRALVDVIHSAYDEVGVPRDALQFIADPDRSLVTELLKLYEYIDMVIPRGGAALHRYCRENSLIPVITGGIGICHLFVDESADLEASLRVIRNAKIQRPTVCNALDTVLVHQDVAARIIPRLIQLLARDGVTFRADPISMGVLGQAANDCVKPAGPDDYDTEWLSLVLGIKVVAGLADAIDHITAHSTGHSDGILTGNDDHARRFIQEVDSAAVYVNASTRFTDGSQMGLGSEVAISTQRLHARGPMGLQELTTYKWVAEGDYLVRA